MGGYDCSKSSSVAVIDDDDGDFFVSAVCNQLGHGLALKVIGGRGAEYELPVCLVCDVRRCCGGGNQEDFICQGIISTGFYSSACHWAYDNLAAVHFSEFLEGCKADGRVCPAVLCEEFNLVSVDSARSIDLRDSQFDSDPILIVPLLLLQLATGTESTSKSKPAQAAANFLSMHFSFYKIRVLNNADDITTVV